MLEQNNPAEAFTSNGDEAAYILNELRAGSPRADCDASARVGSRARRPSRAPPPAASACLCAAWDEPAAKPWDPVALVLHAAGPRGAARPMPLRDHLAKRAGDLLRDYLPGHDEQRSAADQPLEAGERRRRASSAPARRRAARRAGIRRAEITRRTLWALRRPGPGRSRPAERALPRPTSAPSHATSP